MKPHKRPEMKTWASLKMNYFSNKKAQSSTELATFGSVLLLVLSFFVSYGMRYNYQQTIQMRSFRKALSSAYYPFNPCVLAPERPDTSALVMMAKDKHVPDPRDMFGAGNFVPVTGQAEVTWGNTLQNAYDDSDDTNLPQIEYKINDRYIIYTTAGYYTSDDSLANYYVEIPDVGRREVAKADMKIYNPFPIEDPDNPESYLPATQILIDLTPGEPDAKRKKKEVFDEVAISENGPMMKIIKVEPTDGSHGDPVTSFRLLDPTLGQIDRRYIYTQLNSDVDRDGTPDVTPDTVQGLLPFDTDTRIGRGDSLKLEEAPGKTGKRQSTGSFRLETNVTRKIKFKNASGGTNIDNVSSQITRSVTDKIWQTSK